MEMKNLASHSGGKVLSTKADVHWSHRIAAVSLVAGAVLLIMGRKREALLVAGGGAAATLLERPESVQDLWSQLPGHIRNGQDFLVRAEGFVEKLGEQAARLREIISKQA